MTPAAFFNEKRKAPESGTDRTRKPPVQVYKNRTLLWDCSHRANCSTRTAAHAFVSSNLALVIYFADSLWRALTLTGTTVDALVRNFVSHVTPRRILGYYYSNTSPQKKQQFNSKLTQGDENRVFHDIFHILHTVFDHYGNSRATRRCFWIFHLYT